MAVKCREPASKGCDMNDSEVRRPRSAGVALRRCGMSEDEECVASEDHPARGSSACTLLCIESPGPTCRSVSHPDHRLSKCAPMIAVIGLGSLVAGSTSTAKVASVTAPIEYNESLGPNTTGLVAVSFNSRRVITASPRSPRSRRPSASVNSRVRDGSIPISSRRLSGINVYSVPLSIRNSSSKNQFGSFGLATLALTLNIPIFVSSILSSRREFMGNRRENRLASRAQGTKGESGKTNKWREVRAEIILCPSTVGFFSMLDAIDRYFVFLVVDLEKNTISARPYSVAPGIGKLLHAEWSWSRGKRFDMAGDPQDFLVRKKLQVLLRGRLNDYCVGHDSSDIDPKKRLSPSRFLSHPGRTCLLSTRLIRQTQDYCAAPPNLPSV